MLLDQDLIQDLTLAPIQDLVADPQGLIHSETKKAAIKDCLFCLF